MVPVFVGVKDRVGLHVSVKVVSMVHVPSIVTVMKVFLQEALIIVALLVVNHVLVLAICIIKELPGRTVILAAIDEPLIAVVGVVLVLVFMLVFTYFVHWCWHIDIPFILGLFE